VGTTPKEGGVESDGKTVFGSVWGGATGSEFLNRERKKEKKKKSLKSIAAVGVPQEGKCLVLKITCWEGKKRKTGLDEGGKGFGSSGKIFLERGKRPSASQRKKKKYSEESILICRKKKGQWWGETGTSCRKRNRRLKEKERYSCPLFSKNAHSPWGKDCECHQRSDDAIGGRG